LLPEAVDVALALDVTTYDALYLALVEATDERLVTADAALLNTAARDARFAGRVMMLGEAGV
jgi:predicted nucleic acid-binding protein